MLFPSHFTHFPDYPIAYPAAQTHFPPTKCSLALQEPHSYVIGLGTDPEGQTTHSPLTSPNPCLHLHFWRFES